MPKERAIAPRAERVDRREAILRAAIDVFGREGYARASIDEIAGLAGVAKPTVYNRFTDKATVFVEAVARAATQSNDRVVSVIDAMSTQPHNLRAELEHLGTALVGCAMHPDGAAAIRLSLTEQAEFGQAFDRLRTEGRLRTVDRLAGKLAQLATTGHLRLTNPQRAARHFLALVSDEALARSGYGTTVLTPDDVVGPVAEAVETFLAAFGNEA
jgi:TetR/AcrR family transcriptional regulator, mexJK operon transcriptional repressor